MSVITQRSTYWEELFTATETWVCPSKTDVVCMDATDGSLATANNANRPTSVASPWGTNFGKAHSYAGNAHWLCGAGFTNSAGGPCTLECRYKPSSLDTTNGHVICGQWTGTAGTSTYQIGIAPTTSNYRAQMVNGSGVVVTLDSGIQAVVGTAVVLSCTYSGSTFYFHVDGVMVASASVTSGNTGGNSTQFTIGGYANFAYCNGIIDEVRVSINARYTSSNYTPATTPFSPDGNTSGLWHLEERGYDVTSINFIECRGGGNKGGNGSALAGGGGGGGGAYSKKTAALAVTPGTSYFISVPNQGDAWFNTSNAAPTSTTTGCLAKAGGAGGNANLGTPGTAGAAGTTSASVGDTKFAGGAGAAGTTIAGGGGGGGAGDAGNGGAAGSPNAVDPGAGGTSGGGSGGKGGSATGGAAAVGVAPGGGGGGGQPVTSEAGAGGSRGQVIIAYNRSYSLNPAETQTTADTVSRAGSTFNRTQTESVGAATDSVARVYGAVRTISESSSAVDTVTRRFVGARTQTETTATQPATDTVSRTFTGFRSISESVGAALDTVSRIFVGARTRTESVGPASDTVSRVFVGARTRAESVGPAADTVSRVQVLARTRSESVGPASDTVSRLVVFARTILETLTTTDVVTRIVAFNRSRSETVGPAADTVSRVLALARTRNEVVGPASDSVTRQVVFNRVIGEYPPGVTPDYPITNPTKSISGVVYNHEDGTVVAGAIVKLIRDVDDKVVQTAVSNGVGAFSWPRDTADPYEYHYTADYEILGVQYHGISDRGLIPV